MGSTPLCINGVSDHAAIKFGTGLLDLAMDLAFNTPSTTTVSDRWKTCSARLGALGTALRSSTAPPWAHPVQTPGAVMASLLDNSSELFTLEGDADTESEEEGPTAGLAQSGSPSAGPSPSSGVVTPAPLSDSRTFAPDQSHAAHAHVQSKFAPQNTGMAEVSNKEGSPQITSDKGKSFPFSSL